MRRERTGGGVGGGGRECGRRRRQGGGVSRPVVSRSVVRRSAGVRRERERRVQEGGRGRKLLSMGKDAAARRWKCRGFGLMEERIPPFLLKEDVLFLVFERARGGGGFWRCTYKFKGQEELRCIACSKMAI